MPPARASVPTWIRYAELADVGARVSAFAGLDWTRNAAGSGFARRYEALPAARRGRVDAEVRDAIGFAAAGLEALLAGDPVPTAAAVLARAIDASLARVEAALA
jgi:hypothetical protein